MIPCSDNFINVLKSPFQKELYIKIELYSNTMNFIKEITKEVTKNDIGSISVDRSRPIRRSFSFSLNNSNGEFTWGENSIVWIDKRVKVYTGLKLRNGAIEYIPQGVFILTEPQDQHTPEGKIVNISGQDKAFLFNDKRGKFINETIIATGTNVATAIKTIAQANGETLFLFDNVSDTVPYELTYSQGDNRWNAMQELAALAKCEIFYDVNGYLTLRKIEDLNDLQNESAVWTFTKGDPFYAGNVRKMDESQLYNDFVAIGGGSQTETVRHQLTVTESDPLWSNSPYTIEKIGRNTYFHNDGNADPLLSSVDECKWRNKYELMKKLGYAEQISLNIAPLFVLDASDIIQIEDEENNVTGRYMVEKFDVPLRPQLLTVEASKEVPVVVDWNAI